MQVIDEAYEMIDNALEEDEINSSTYQCAADIIQLCDPEEQEIEPARETLKELLEMTLNELREWRKQDIGDFKEGLTVEEFSERFDIGGLYSSEEEVIDSTDWNFFVTRLLPKLTPILTGVEPALAIDDRLSQSGAGESIHDLMETTKTGSRGISSNQLDVNQELVDVTGNRNRLTGVELLAKVNELEHANKTDLVRSCGYWSSNDQGNECLYFTEFYEALLAAKGVSDCDIQEYFFDKLIPVGESLELVLTNEYTETMGLEPEDVFYLTATGENIILFIEGSDEIDVNSGDCDFCAIVNRNNEIHIPSNLAAEIGFKPGDLLKVRQGRSSIKLSK